MRLLPVAVLLVSGAARADTLAAVAGDGTLVGPSGQVYESDGHGAWVRKVAGGVGDDVDAAIRAGGTLIVGSAGHGPPYRFSGGAWNAIPIALHAKAIVAHGTRPVAAVGRLVFALDRTGDGTKLPDAPAAVLAIGAGSGVVIATERGVLRLEGKSWRAIPDAPHPKTFAGDRWALVDGGAFDLRDGKSVSWPRGVTITAAAPSGDALVGAGVTGTNLDVVVVRGAKLDHDTTQAPSSARVIGVAMDKDGKLVIALADGHVVTGKPGAWTATEIRDELPPPKPGPAPAISP